MLDMTKLYIEFQWFLIFTQGQRVVEKPEHVKSFCRKVALSYLNVWLCKGDDFKGVI